MIERFAARRGTRRSALGIGFLALWLVSAAGLAQQLPAALDAEFERTQLGANAASVLVAPLDGGKLSIAFNRDVPMNPASTMKLVTSYAALELLGPAFFYRTTFSSSAPIEHGVLAGDLYVHGSGDPHLTQEDLWLMLRQLRARGIREIAGNVVVDRSVYAPIQSDPGQFDGEPYRPYNVAPDGFLVNFNASTLWFHADVDHKKVIAYVDPAIDEQSISPPRYSSEACGDWRARLGADLTNPLHIGFSGVFSGSCGDKSFNVSLESASSYSARLFTSLWTEVGGTLRGHVLTGLAPGAVTPLVEHDSQPLAILLYDMNKYSNNLMARSLYLTLSSEVLHTPGNAESSGRVVKSLLAQRNVDSSQMELDNGSGLSRRERITAATMGQVLTQVWLSSNMPEFMASLPLVGADGTMKNRLRSDAVAGHAHIKTGTLADARAIAGFVDSASGHRYVVVCFVNDPASDRAKPFQDALLNWVFDNG